MPDRRASARRAPAPTSSGVHFLSAGRVAGGLVASARVGVGDVVLDLGAGHGAVTAVLAATGASVLAVERDAAFVARLRRRFADHPQVRVIHGDLRQVALPRRRFQVVASLPFAVSTPLLRRILVPGQVGLAGADVLVEWGLARRLTQPVPRNLEGAWWAACFQLRLERRVPAACFTPAPTVDAAHLVIRPRPGMDGHTRRVVWALLHAAYTIPGQPAKAVVGQLVGRRRAHRLLTASGIDPPAPAGTVTVSQWVQLGCTLASGDAAGMGSGHRRSG